MQTSFTENQLKDKDNKTSETIIRKCVHCGMCNATCPTFNLLGDELDGPRGRIYLIKEMIEIDGPVIADICVDKEENCFPMIQSGSAHNEMVLNKEQKQDAKSAEKGKVLV